MIREISTGRVSKRLLFEGLMAILISGFESVHLDQNGSGNEVESLYQDSTSPLSSLASAAPTHWDDPKAAEDC